jgi:hypothetical protein
MVPIRDLKQAGQEVVEAMERVLKEMRIEQGLDDVSELLGGARSVRFLYER